MKEKGSKERMEEKIRGQTAHTLISPGISGYSLFQCFSKCTGFAFVQIQLILTSTLFNFSYGLSLGFNIRHCGSALDESERSILRCFSQQAALPSEYCDWCLVADTRESENLPNNLERELAGSLHMLLNMGEGCVCVYKKRRKDLGVPYLQHSCLVTCLPKKTPWLSVVSHNCLRQE